MTVDEWAAFFEAPRTPLAVVVILAALCGASWMYALSAGRTYRRLVRQIRAYATRGTSTPHPTLGPAWRRNEATGAWTHEGPGDPTVNVSPGALWRSYAARPDDRPVLERTWRPAPGAGGEETVRYHAPEAGWYEVTSAGLRRVNDIDHGSGVPDGPR